MDSYIKWMNKLPKWAKILFAFPILNFMWGFYRFFKSCRTNKILHIILGLLMIFLCPAIFWVVDLITIIFTGKVIWID